MTDEDKAEITRIVNERAKSHSSQSTIALVAIMCLITMILAIMQEVRWQRMKRAAEDVRENLRRMDY